MQYHASFGRTVRLQRHPHHALIPANGVRGRLVLQRYQGSIFALDVQIRPRSGYATWASTRFWPARERQRLAKLVELQVLATSPQKDPVYTILVPVTVYATYRKDWVEHFVGNTCCPKGPAGTNAVPLVNERRVDVTRLCKRCLKWLADNAEAFKLQEALS